MNIQNNAEIEVFNVDFGQNKLTDTPRVMTRLTTPMSFTTAKKSFPGIISTAFMCLSVIPHPLTGAVGSTKELYVGVAGAQVVFASWEGIMNASHGDVHTIRWRRYIINSSTYWSAKISLQCSR